MQVHGDHDGEPDGVNAHFEEDGRDDDDDDGNDFEEVEEEAEQEHEEHDGDEYAGYATRQLHQDALDEVVATKQAEDEGEEGCTDEDEEDHRGVDEGFARHVDKPAQAGRFAFGFVCGVADEGEDERAECADTRGFGRGGGADDDGAQYAANQQKRRQKHEKQA